ncbi:glycosyltransferase family 4 protein [Spirosoma jeollabukense]
MNIILDAGLLGIGFYHRQAQTGVGRVVEQLMTGLWQADGVNLSLAASSHLPETMRYARVMFGPSRPSFVNRPADQAWGAFENSILSPLAVGSLPSKAIRYGFYQAKKTFGSKSVRFNMNQWTPDSIYHSPFYPIPGAVGRNPTIHTVQTIHDLISVFHPEWFPNGDDTVKQVINSLTPATQITTVSNATKQDLCNYTQIDPARVTPIQLAASPTLFTVVTDTERKRSIRAKYGLGDSPYLLSLATFEPRKNIDHLVRSFVRLATSGDIPADVKLVLVGTKGWKFDKIMAELTQNEALRSRLVVTGFVPDAELAPLYSDALAFVYPSLYEGFGLPPLEAMQCGLPIITSDIPAINEVVGDAAVRVPPTDSDALCQAILTVVASQSVRTALSEKAVKRASLFSWDKFTAEHVALYKRILSE